MHSHPSLSRISLLSLTSAPPQPSLRAYKLLEVETSLSLASSLLEEPAVGAREMGRGRSLGPEGKREITGGLICSKVAELNQLNSFMFICCSQMTSGTRAKEISRGSPGQLSRAQGVFSSETSKELGDKFSESQHGVVVKMSP